MSRFVLLAATFLSGCGLYKIAPLLPPPIGEPGMTSIGTAWQRAAVRGNREQRRRRHRHGPSVPAPVVLFLPFLTCSCAAPPHAALGLMVVWVLTMRKLSQPQVEAVAQQIAQSAVAREQDQATQQQQQQRQRQQQQLQGGAARDAAAARGGEKRSD